MLLWQVGLLEELSPADYFKLRKVPCPNTVPPYYTETVPPHKHSSVPVYSGAVPALKPYHHPSTTVYGTAML